MIESKGGKLYDLVDYHRYVDYRTDSKRKFICKGSLKAMYNYLTF